MTVRRTDLHGRARTRTVRGLAVTLGAVAATSLAACGGSEETGYQVRAIFDSASFITNGLDVRVAGVSVGAVDSVELTDDNQAAVTFTITDPGFQDMRKDAKCEIRPQALIGERFIECQLTQERPEGATAPPEIPAIAEGPYAGQHLLPVENTSVPVDPDQLLNMNTSSVRERFAVIIRELGAGVAGRGDEIAKTLAKSNDALTYANRILKQLSEQEEMLKSLVTSSDQTLASLANERAAVSGTISNGAVVAKRLASRKSELQASIASLNNLLDEVSPTVDKVDELADQLQPIADDLNRSSDDLATILNDLPELSKEGTQAVNALGPTVNRAGDILTSDTNNALIDRLVKTSAAVKSSGSVLGLALGDFRTTGGLDYFLDAIYGVAYSMNGRDQNGYYLRGAVLNVTNCGAIANLLSGCSVSNPPGLKASTESTNSASTSGASAKPGAETAEKAAADLVLGGDQ